MIDILPGFIHTLRLDVGNKTKERDVPCLFYYVAENLDRPDLPHSILLIARASLIQNAESATVIVPSVRHDRHGEHINLQDRIQIPVQMPGMETPPELEWHVHEEFDMAVKKADYIFEVLEEENVPIWVDFVSFEVITDDPDPRKILIGSVFDLDGLRRLDDDFKQTLPAWREHWKKRGK